MTTAPIYHGSPLPRRHYGATVNPEGYDEQTWRRLMSEWYELTPCGGDAWQTWANCPHLVGSGPGPVTAPAKCRDGGCGWLNQWHTTTLWDHARAWRNADGHVVVTLEPFGNPFDETEEYDRLTSELRALGVGVAFEGRSPYGATYLLALMADRGSSAER